MTSPPPVPPTSPLPRLGRRDVLKLLGIGTGAAAAVAAAPGRARVGRLFDERSAVAADAPAVRFVRVAPVEGRRAAVLARLDDTHRVLADGSHEFLLWPGDEAKLVEAGIPYEVLHPDLLAEQRVRSTRAVGPQPGQREDYRVWEDFEADLRALAEAHPTRARLLELPTRSLLGRTIHGIEIATDVGRRDGRPVVHVDGMHHAREWPAAEMPIMWAHDLLENYGTDPQITRIVDGARTIIVPNINPDGFLRSREAAVHTDTSDPAYLGLYLPLALAGLESYWRKNLHNVSGMALTNPVGRAHDNPDAYGIDLNRNYPFLWGDDEGSSDVPVDQAYRGTDPYSEPEVHNVRDLFRSHAPITAITHHTSGQLMLFAWGRNPGEVRSPDYDLMLDLGLEMNASNGYQAKQAYGLYPTSGTSRDWGHAVCSSLIYTFEHGTEFHGPYADTIPEMYAINRGAFITHAFAALDPATHVVLSGRVLRGGNPVAARVHVTKDALTPTADGREIEDPIDAVCDVGEDGTFSFHVPPSTRPFLAEERFGGPTTEPWTVVVEADGLDPVSIEVTAGRGERVDLGTISL